MNKPDFHFSALLKRLKRGGPAITHPKDAGLIIAYTGLNKESKVIELGSGSGFMTVQMASIAKEVVSYEKRKEFLDLAQSNVMRANFGNVTFKFRDVLSGIDEKDQTFDLVFCDIAEADKIAKYAYDALKKGGYFVCHCLQSEQARLAHLEAQKSFSEVFTIEGTIREYEAKEFGFRPQHFGLTYTAFLVFARK
ncbi:methyltransferase domain-containing protein [Candidatus Micrarchaeota archaeon]|nr:methyltransferase domain-containing protein [Candidatus Micrarchaeota archaeon]